MKESASTSGVDPSRPGSARSARGQGATGSRHADEVCEVLALDADMLDAELIESCAPARRAADHARRDRRLTSPTSTPLTSTVPEARSPAAVDEGASSTRLGPPTELDEPVRRRRARDDRRRRRDRARRRATSLRRRPVPPRTARLRLVGSTTAQRPAGRARLVVRPGADVPQGDRAGPRCSPARRRSSWPSASRPAVAAEPSGRAGRPAGEIDALDVVERRRLERTGARRRGGQGAS